MVFASVKDTELEYSVIGKEFIQWDNFNVPCSRKVASHL